VGSPSWVRFLAGLPTPTLPPLDSLTALLLPALGVFLVGYRIDAHQELLALGAANVGASVFRGFPVSSSGSRTAIGDVAGNRSQRHSLVALLSVVLVLLPSEASSCSR
jgi:sulfate permease, SulP family